MKVSTNAPLGLSVLLPVYCFDVRGLVRQLSEQLQTCTIPWEIRCYDDGSTQDFIQKNIIIVSAKNLIYKELKENIGRSRIRNLLAQEANYSWLLMIDSDSGLPDNQYIQRYIAAIKSGQAQVFIGGTIYEKELLAPEVSLRWHYGRQREQVPAPQRQRKAYESITLNNILINRELYLSSQLDETLTTYGHEDTKFGYGLAQKKAIILHLDNPVLHLGLEPNLIFIEKTKIATHNFYKISQLEGFGRQTKLYKMFLFIKNWHLSSFFQLIFSVLWPFCKKNLLSAKPSVIWLDFLKLDTMFTAEKNHQNES